MTTFTTKQILDTGDLFRPIPKKYRDIITGLMMGVNLAEDKNVLPNMVSAAIALVESNKSA